VSNVHEYVDIDSDNSTRFLVHKVKVQYKA